MSSSFRTRRVLYRCLFHPDVQPLTNRIWLRSRRGQNKHEVISDAERLLKWSFCWLWLEKKQKPNRHDVRRVWWRSWFIWIFLASEHPVDLCCSNFQKGILSVTEFMLRQRPLHTASTQSSTAVRLSFFLPLWRTQSHSHHPANTMPFILVLCTNVLVV